MPPTRCRSHRGCVPTRRDGRDGGARTPRQGARRPRGLQCAVGPGTTLVSILVRRRGPGGLSAAAALASFRALRQVPEPGSHLVARLVVTGAWLVAVLVQLTAVTV